MGYLVAGIVCVIAIIMIETGLRGNAAQLAGEVFGGTSTKGEQGVSGFVGPSSTTGTTSGVQPAIATASNYPQKATVTA